MFISMHSMLGWVNDCISAAWHGDNQPVALLRCNEAQVALITVLHCWVWCLSSGFRSGKFAGQSNTVTRGH